MKNKILTIVLIFSLAVNAATLATVGYHAWRNRCLTQSGPCPLNPSDRHLYESLGLSAGQTAQMAALAHAFHQRLGELDSQVREKRNLLIDLLGKDRPNPTRTESIRREIAGVQDEIQKEVIAHVAEAKKLMNTDQQQRFIALMRASSNDGRPHPPLFGNGGHP